MVTEMVCIRVRWVSLSVALKIRAICVIRDNPRFRKNEIAIVGGVSESRIGTDLRGLVFFCANILIL